MKLYDVIYADPPWRYEFSPTSSRAIEKQYPTMSLDEICQMSVPSSDNAVLFLWATGPKLLDALQVMVAWGFRYRSQAVWDKETIGIGCWFRGQHELLLVGVKGKMTPPGPHQRVGSVIRCRKTTHSAKPLVVRRLISEWFPNKSKIELFARDGTGTDGWYLHGNQRPTSTDVDIFNL